MTIEVGITQFHAAHDGIWIQEGFQHSEKLTSPSLAIGIDIHGNKEWTYNFGAIYVGKVTTNTKAVADAEYNMQTKKCDRKAITECYQTTYNGSGTVSGLTASARRSFGNWSIEPGIILERSTWQVDIPDMQDFRGGDNPCWHYHVEHKVKPIILPTLAIGYKISQSISARLSFIPTIAHGDEYQARYRGVSINSSIRYTF